MKMNQRERAWLLAASLLLGACGTPVVGSDSGSDVVMDTRPTCTADQMVCNSTCVSVQTDRNHCGACGTVCAGGQVCRAGSCEIECPSGQARCSGACVTLSGDRSNCGACGTMCPAGQVCSAGACATTCASGLTDCMGSCRDVQNDRTNCGACGTMCPSGQVCSMGACATSCPMGQVECAGACVNTQSDRANCGACGTSCAAGQICTAGVCTISCLAGQTVCGGTCTDTQTDRANCGMCGTACAAGQVCNMGTCELSCAAGQTVCSGACADTQSDRANCGMCGTACAAGQVCSMGVCTLSCSAGQTNCSDSCVSLPTNPSNCGACGTVCGPYANAIASCGASTCIMTCNAGFADCNAMRGDGCESNQNTDINNCGRCGNRCAFANAVAGCGMGACQLVSCNAGFEDADGLAANGCEARSARVGNMGAPFTGGTLNGLAVDPMTGAIAPSGMVSMTSEDLLWIVNTAESTLSKWNAVTDPPVELARYRVGIAAGECAGRCCFENGCNMASRVVTDGNGDVYVANRGFGTQGTVTKIAGDRRNCIDRNGNGMIDTSTGRTNVLPYTIAAGMGMGQPADECVLWTANVGPLDAVLRALAIDRGDAMRPNGYVWVGGYNNSIFYKLDPNTGATLASLAVPVRPYGGVVIADGRLFIGNLDNGATASINTTVMPPTVTPAIAFPTALRGGCINAYGITADPAGRVWFAGWSCRDALGYNTATGTWTRVDTTALIGGTAGRGITVGGDGNVYMAGGNSGESNSRVVRWAASSFVAGGTIPAASVSLVVSPNLVGASALGFDRSNNLWLAHYVNAAGGSLIRHNVVTSTTAAFTGPNQVYSYTDFTGSIRRTSIPQGSYDQTFDLGCAAPRLLPFLLDGTFPVDTLGVINMRTAATAVGLAAAADVNVATLPPSMTPYDLAAIFIRAGITPQQFMRVSITLRSSVAGATPVVRSISLRNTCP